MEKTVSYSSCDRGVSQGFAHQVTQQRVGAQEAQADVGGLGELPQNRRVGEVHGTRTSVHQRHHNLDMCESDLGIIKSQTSQ